MSMSPRQNNGTANLEAIVESKAQPVAEAQHPMLI
jgi:hypothetical protein